MQFTTFNFLLFFVLVCLVHALLPGKLRRIWLLISSYFFYCSWNAAYGLVLAGVTLTTWISGLLLEKAAGSFHPVRLKKTIVAVTVILNIGALFVFKYSNFAIYNLNRILKLVRLPAYDVRFDWLIPVGISFFILQALSYTIDCFRGRIAPERNLFRYALFVSFFPQILSGPIGKAREMLPQIRENKPFDFDRAKHGLWLMLWGYYQKMVIGDRLALFVNGVFDQSEVYRQGGLVNLLAMVFFALQLYCDFGGYSNIAIGAAQVLGFSIPANFRRPYFAKSIHEFWQRWHISLTGWFREYLYFPLGGNRQGRLRQYRNILVVFLVSGLWHGADWTFLIWGFLHAFYQLIEVGLRPLGKRLGKKLRFNAAGFGWKALRCGLVFALTDFAWIFFRANTVHDAFGFIRGLAVFNPQIFRDGGLFRYGLDRINFQIALAGLSVLLIVSWLQRGGGLRAKVDRLPAAARWAILLAGIYAVLLFGMYGPNVDTAQFIYTQF